MYLKCHVQQWYKIWEEKIHEYDTKENERWVNCIVCSIKFYMWKIMKQNITKYTLILLHHPFVGLLSLLLQLSADCFLHRCMICINISRQWTIGRLSFIRLKAKDDFSSLQRLPSDWFKENQCLAYVLLQISTWQCNTFSFSRIRQTLHLSCKKPDYFGIDRICAMIDMLYKTCILQVGDMSKEKTKL